MSQVVPVTMVSSADANEHACFFDEQGFVATFAVPDPVPDPVAAEGDAAPTSVYVASGAKNSDSDDKSDSGAAAATARAFYEQHGFVVFRDVFSAEECEDTRSAMWDIVEEGNPGLRRDDPHSWTEYNQVGKYGLSSRGPCFHPQLVANRQHINLAASIACVLRVEQGDLMVSHDRFTIYRATGLDPESYVSPSSYPTAPSSSSVTVTRATDASSSGGGGGDGSAEHPGKSLLTGRRNVHLDLNPWWWAQNNVQGNRDVLFGANSIAYSCPEDLIKENNLVVQPMGNHAQCVLNFNDNLAEDGGTLVVPGSHLPHAQSQWCTEHKSSVFKRRPFVTFDSETNASDAAVERKLMKTALRVTMRAGSLLIWNQCLFHGTTPNHSRRCRLAQFLKAFSCSKSFTHTVVPSLAALAAGSGSGNACNVSGGENGNKSKSRLKKEASRERRRLRELEAAGSAASASAAAPASAPAAAPAASAAETSAGAATEADIEAKSKAPTINTITSTSTGDLEWKWDGHARLTRRAKLIEASLQESDALKFVTPLGRSLFGLDRKFTDAMPVDRSRV